jgi:hypothetical protein
MNGLREWENDSSGCEDTLGRGQIVEFDTHSEDAIVVFCLLLEPFRRLASSSRSLASNSFLG